LPEPECGARRGGSWGTIVLKGDDRAFYEEWACSGGNEVQTMKVANGERLYQIATVRQPDGSTFKSRGVEEMECASPRGRVGENLRVAFARSGRSGVDWVLSMLLESTEKRTPCP